MCIQATSTQDENYHLVEGSATDPCAIAQSGAIRTFAKGDEEVSSGSLPQEQSPQRKSSKAISEVHGTHYL